MASRMMILKKKQAIGLEEEGEAEEEFKIMQSYCGLSTPLSPLMEGPTPQRFENVGVMRRGQGRWGWLGLGQLLGYSHGNKPTYLSTSPRGLSISSRGILSIRGTAPDRSDLCLLLGVLGAPLAPMPTSSSHPIPSLSFKTISMATSSAQYIIQQYICATGIAKLGNVQNLYAMGRVKMLASEFEAAAAATIHMAKAKSSWRAAESGCFVLWQMAPDMWNVEMVVGGSKVVAGSDGRLIWRHTPWLGSHAAKGPVRPLRRALQGLDPRLIATIFSRARCIGEKKIRGEDCFILKLSADPGTLSSRSEGPAEIIRHIMSGYFSQKTGLLIQLEDSHLTKIQATSAEEAVFWETNIDTSVEEYRAVDGISVAHSGRTTATLFRFGEVAMSHTKTRLEEEWVIDEVAFGVPGLSSDLFIPPADIVRIDPHGDARLDAMTHGRRARGLGSDNCPSRVRRTRGAAAAGPDPSSESCTRGIELNAFNEGLTCGKNCREQNEPDSCNDRTTTTCVGGNGFDDPKSNERRACGNRKEVLGGAAVASNEKLLTGGGGHGEFRACNERPTVGGHERQTLGFALSSHHSRTRGYENKAVNAYNERSKLDKVGNPCKTRHGDLCLDNIIWRVEV